MGRNDLEVFNDDDARVNVWVPSVRLNPTNCLHIRKFLLRFGSAHLHRRNRKHRRDGVVVVETRPPRTRRSVVVHPVDDCVHSTRAREPIDGDTETR